MKVKAFLLALLFVFSFVACGESEVVEEQSLVPNDAEKYENALGLINEGEYTKAYIALKALGNYKDCKAILERFTVKYGRQERTFYDADGKMSLKTVYGYDSKGNQILYAEYDKLGALISEQRNEFDEYGNCKLITFLDKDGSVVSKSEFRREYDENGNLTLYETSEGKNVYRYDDNGNCTEEIKYDENGEFVLRYVHIYENGKKKETDEYNEKGDVVLLTLYEYDEYGNVTSELVLDKELNEVQKSVFEYDKNQRETLCATYDENGNISFKQEQAFDDFGNLITLVAYAEDGSAESIYKYKYDDHNNLISVAEYDDKNKQISISSYQNEYEFDEMGNMTLYRRLYEGTETELFVKIYEFDENGFMTRYLSKSPTGNPDSETIYSEPIVIYNVK